MSGKQKSVLSISASMMENSLSTRGVIHGSFIKFGLVC